MMGILKNIYQSVSYIVYIVFRFIDKNI